MTARTSIGFLLLAVAVGWFAGVRADAQEPTPVPPRHLSCRAFQGVSDRDWVIDTSDRTTEIGQWVDQQARLGWRVEGVDFEVGTKPTGYPSTWAEVCLTR
jgi:hypothetical protein